MGFDVLVSSAGRRVALLDIFRLTLTELGLDGRVLAADMSARSSAFHAADAGWVVPPCTDPRFPAEMLRICREGAVRLLVPTIDTELEVYAENRAGFEREGIALAVSSPEVVRICNDKVRTHAWLVASGLPTVRQGLTEEVRLDGWRFPLLVKPRYGSSSTGVVVVEDHAAFEVAVRGGEFLVQSLAAGVEYTLDILADVRGRCVCVVPRRRLEVRAGESSKGVTVRFEELEDLGRRICEALPGAYGPLTAQVFHDAGGELNVIELNARFAGGFPLSWQAGAGYPRWMIEEILGLESTASPDAWRSDVVMLRYDEAIFVDAEAAGL